MVSRAAFRGFVAGCLLLAGRAGAQAVLAADAHVSSARPLVNSGALTNLNVGGGYTSLLQFDLSMMPAGTTASQVSRAVLRVYCNRADTPGAVSVQPVVAGWSEYGVTYATLPSLSAVAGTAQAAADSYTAFDVTAVVQGWVSAPSTNFGVALTAATAVVQFDSKENDQTGHAASLEIVLAASGVSGPQGPAGAQGPQGVQGPVGAAGPAGAAGMQGAQGPAGVQGVAGATGPTGSPGPAGAQGMAGATGPAGSAGPAGVAGSNGATGPVGATGMPGLVYQGAYASSTNYALGDVAVFAGSSYASLAASNHGNTPGASPSWWGLLTAQGPQGLQGFVGPTGAQGTQGPAGSVGPAGEKGNAGAQGPAGQAGAQGIAGVAGPQGAAGPVGAQGVAGPVGMTFRGAYDSTVNYAAGDGVTFGSAGYVSVLNGNRGNTPGVVPGTWLLFAMGSAGATGAVGATGAQGIAGPQGPAGPQGISGVAGATGAQGQGLVPQGAYSSVANYAAGDVVGYGGSSYVSLVASNHGQTPDVSPAFWTLLVAKGDAGSAGAAGAIGPHGLTGPSGQNGAAGPAGPAGMQGATGSQGPVGAQGLPGATGAKGDRGDAGAQGVAGQAGAQGLQGIQGIAGAQGPAGPQGAQGIAGPTGPAGAAGTAGINFRGAWQQGVRYALNDAVVLAGSTYLAQAANQNIQPDTDSQTWALVAQAGGAGPTGAAATVSVGTPVTLAPGAVATVTNIGTGTNAVLVFGIPQGAKGDTGAAGSSGGSGGSSGGGGSFAAMYHAVSFTTNYYALNAPTAAATETAAVFAWVPRGCSAVRLDVYSQQSNAVTVTVRSGTPGAMQNTALSCSPAANGGSCNSTGVVAVAAGSFLDLNITGASGTQAGVWTALECD